MAERDNILQTVWITTVMLYWAQINTISTLDALDEMLLKMAIQVASGYTTFADFKSIW